MISAELSGILERLGSSAESWRARLEKLKSGRLLGRFFAASRERLRAVAAQPGGASSGEPGRMPGAVAGGGLVRRTGYTLAATGRSSTRQIGRVARLCGSSRRVVLRLLRSA